MVAVSFIDGGNWRKSLTNYHKMYHVHLTIRGIRTHNFSGDRQLPQTMTMTAPDLFGV
jgi:hypothetical protein